MVPCDPAPGGRNSDVLASVGSLQKKVREKRGLGLTGALPSPVPASALSQRDLNCVFTAVRVPEASVSLAALAFPMEDLIPEPSLVI